MEPVFRASHADRQAVIDALGGHTAAGRLDLDEYTARVDAALAAVTLNDLALLTRDLPGAPDLTTTGPTTTGTTATGWPWPDSAPQSQQPPTSGGAGFLAANPLLMAFAVATAALIVIGIALAAAR